MFWIAKINGLQGNFEESRSLFEEVAEIDPSGYYSERAADLLLGLAPFENTMPTNTSFDLLSEQAEAEAWMRRTFDLEENQELSGLGNLSIDERFIRGQEFWELGEFEMARSEFESLRMGILDDPVSNYQLANYLIDIGLYRSGIYAARQVLNVAGLSDAESLNAPIYFNRLRFGLYFDDLIISEAEDNLLDPLFVTSVIRQESLFEGFVTSSAGARGLMQIIPSTGQEISNLSGWPLNYTAKDLYRPNVSITLGANYLGRQRNNFDENLYAALAAYNAGPGWASYWSSFANDDLDLFLEIVHFPETANYIRSIYEIYSIYSDIYTDN